MSQLEIPELKQFLEKLSLDGKYELFLANGIKQVEHLRDIQESDITLLELTVFEWRRLQRETQQTLEDTTRSVKKTSIPAYKTSTASKVISLPKTFKNFFETRDGQGNIVVSTEPLKRKFKDLWYENPCTPAQEFSNSIILQMAEQRMQHEKRKRDCELWCRKQRAKRIYFLLATTEQPLVFSTWTHYFKNQSIMGKLGLIKEQYPTLATFIDDLGNDAVDNVSISALGMYDALCQVVGKLEEVSTFCDTAIGKCEEEISSCLINTDGQPKRGINPNIKK